METRDLARNALSSSKTQHPLQMKNEERRRAEENVEQHFTSSNRKINKTKQNQTSKEQVVAYLEHKMNTSIHGISSLAQQLLAYGSSDLHRNDISPLPPDYDSYYQKAIRYIASKTVYNIRRVGLSQKSQNCSKVSSREELGDYLTPRNKLCERYDLEASLSHREILTNVIRAKVYDAKAVTLVTHLSDDRTSTLEKIVQHWKGKC